MFVKRVFDMVIATMGLLILLPLFIIIALLIKFTSSGPIFFKQQRVGMHAKVFQIHKFRTMIVNSENLGPKITITGDKRITALGKLLRKTKLDELPQLIDVILGNMSLVGPRPEVPEYVKYYPENIKHLVLSVRPGITDWASINMIDESDILASAKNPKETYIQEILPKKLEFAMKYVNNRSLLQDCIIIFSTILKIFIR